MIEPKEILKNISRISDGKESRIGKIMRLDRNERTTPFDRKMVNAVLQNLRPEELTAYPELEPLYQKLAKVNNVTRENILLCNGSDAGIKNLFEVYVEKGNEVILLKPTYGMFFVYCDMFGAVQVPVEYNPDFSLPVERVLNKINKRTKILMLANPNHTGTIIVEKDLSSIIKRAAEFNAIVLIDEAYYHFYDGTMLPYINHYDNLIIIRTFSKAYGLAALRIGYIISQTQNIHNLDKVRATYEITSLSAKFAEYCLDHPETYQDYVNDVNAGKEYLVKEFKELGLESLPSVTNFIFIRLPQINDARIVVFDLKENNISIKGPFKGVPLDGLIRITVGPVEQMQIFMKTLKYILNKVTGVRC